MSYHVGQYRDFINKTLHTYYTHVLEELIKQNVNDPTPRLNVESQIKLIPTATELLLGTAAVESSLGKFLWSNLGTENPVAFGPYQMELPTEDYLLKFMYIRNPYLRNAYERALHRLCPIRDLVANLTYSTIMARLKYLSIPEPLPPINTANRLTITHALKDDEDVRTLGRYWKQYYNTMYGKGTVEAFINAYRRFVG